MTYRFVMFAEPVYQGKGKPEIEPEIRSAAPTLTLGELRQAIAALADEPDDLPVVSGYYDVTGVGCGPVSVGHAAGRRLTGRRVVDIFNSE